MPKGTFDTSRAKELTFSELIKIFKHNRCNEIYLKELAPNDNSKNQPYFGAHLTDIPFIPTDELESSISKSKKTSNLKRKIKYQAKIKLLWLDAEGKHYPAPHSKLIYYPQYPEIRFSGFLKGSSVDASYWMDPKKEGRSRGRWLILGIQDTGNVLAYLVTPNCNLSSELSKRKFTEITSVFKVVQNSTPKANTSNKELLLAELKAIHEKGWIQGQRIYPSGKVLPYSALNGGGYTLEAELGISPNGIAEPDYLGWEIKQYGVTRFPRIGAKPTTLLTPEPNGGIYNTEGVIAFMTKYGYKDKSGIKDRFNFGGKHIIGVPNKTTKLTMLLDGFDKDKNEITNPDGKIMLVKGRKNVASWSFPKILNHWKTKHSKTVFIPCLRRSSSDGKYQYQFGNQVQMGTGTDFLLLLNSLTNGSVYYDPGIKLENASSKPKVKRRNQFRILHRKINNLYNTFEDIDVQKY
ncbi:hypothetical protein GCM10009123_05210 [Kangiella japonica]|uniref:MvaI/BcnI restriction endonuclease domain-containing protein n=1 Tax=Kangiella japonica TaxID=647384 RepID=A0ABP3CE38_9GAMM